MALVGAFDAKTHLAELLDRVSRGEKITITSMAFLRRCWSLSGKQAQE